MTQQATITGRPKKILLATDLSSRSDRALDRAASLAAQWQTSLIVLHVLENFGPTISESGPLPSWRRPPDPADAARKHLLADIAPLAARATVSIGEGVPADAILRTVEREACDLIVVGTARDELLGRFRLGGTVDQLIRRAAVPVLVVKNRPRRPYSRIVVATDFSEPARHALEAAARFFPEQRLTLFHAYDAPKSGLMTDPAAYLRAYRNSAEKECAAFLNALERPRNWEEPDVLMECGSPPSLLRDYMSVNPVDLIVLGTQGRSAIVEVFVGSVAKAIVNDVPCDALLVRQPRAAV